MDNKISVCIITKNEADKLDKCLSHLSVYPFEIVVVDTGSTDNSVEVALKYTNSVHHYEWNDNFSDARNFSISKAQNDVVLILDTDEFLTEMDYARLLALAYNNQDKVGRILRVNIFTRNKALNTNRERVNRLFNKKFFCYKGSIHEQVCRNDGQEYGTYNVPAIFDHIGYDGTPEELEKKARRNITLLEKELEKEDDPYILYQLGKSYYMLRDYQNALVYFERATSYDLESKLEFVADLVVSYGYTLINTGQQEKALMFENFYEEFSYCCDFVFLMGLIYMNNTLFDAAVRQFLKSAEYENCSMDGVNSYLAYYNVGVIYECLGYAKEALEYYSMCGDYEKAEERKKDLLRIGEVKKLT